MDNMIAAGRAEPDCRYDQRSTQSAATIDYPILQAQGTGGIRCGAFEKNIIDDIIPISTKLPYTDDARLCDCAYLWVARTQLTPLSTIWTNAWVGSFSGAFVLWATRVEEARPDSSI